MPTAGLRSKGLVDRVGKLLQRSIDTCIRRNLSFMRYSLQSRFQGALLGLALGEELGSYRGTPRSQATPDPPIYSWQPGRQAAAPGTPCPSWTQKAVWQAEMLLQNQGQAGSPVEFVPTATELNSSKDRMDAIASGAEQALVTLPIALFFHDDEIKLRQQLSQTLPDWTIDGNAQAEVLTVHFAIAQALKERLHPASLIPKAIAYLQKQFSAVGDDPLEMIGQLERVQTWLHQQADLATVLANWLPAHQPVTGAAAIALSLYCFLSTPEDVQLSLLRAARSPRAPQLVCGLTGALSGAHNSTIGIPLWWRWLKSELELPGNNAGSQFGQLAHRLLAAWAGAYDPTQFAVAAIAAPGVIRPR